MAKAKTLSQAEARQQIIDAANRHSIIRHLFLDRKPYKARHLQQCVSIVRRRKLVDDRVLVAAGFRPTGR